MLSNIMRGLTEISQNNWLLSVKMELSTLVYDLTLALSVTIFHPLLSPLSLGPQQIGSKDDGDVAGSHFVHFTVLSQFG